MPRGWGGIGRGGPLSVGPSVPITCLSLEAGPPKEYPPCMARRVSGGCHEPGICQEAGESRRSKVRCHAARGRPLACGCGVRLMWPQTNELLDSSPLVPVAQEWSVDLNRTLSRKEKKKNADGVTLMGINQTGDQASQNKPSRWALGTSVPGKAPRVLCQGWNAPTQGDSPKGPCREPQGIFPDTLLGSSQGPLLGESSFHSVPELWKDSDKEPLPPSTLGPL